MHKLVTRQNVNLGKNNACDNPGWYVHLGYGVQSSMFSATHVTWLLLTNQCVAQYIFYRQNYITWPGSAWNCQSIATGPPGLYLTANMYDSIYIHKIELPVAYAENKSWDTL